MEQNKANKMEKIYKEAKTEEIFYNNLNRDGFDGNVMEVIGVCQEGNFEEAANIASSEGWQ